MKPLRIYVAGPWVDRNAASQVAKRFVQAGHVITHPWWEYEGEDQDKETKEFLEQCAKADVKAVETADLVVVWNTAKSEGKAVEQGLAIAYDKPIICITPGEKPSSNIFHYLRGNYTHVKTVDQALEAVNQYV